MAVWSEIKRSRVLFERRIDADFYSPEALKIEKAILSCTNSKLNNYSKKMKELK